MNGRQLFSGAIGLGLTAGLALGPNVSAASAEGSPQMTTSLEAAGSATKAESATCTGNSDNPTYETPSYTSPVSSVVEELATEIVSDSKATKEMIKGQTIYNLTEAYEGGNATAMAIYNDLGATCVNGHMTSENETLPELIGVSVWASQSTTKVDYEELNIGSSWGSATGAALLWGANAEFYTKKSLDGFGNTPRGTIVGQELAEQDNGEKIINAPIEVTRHGVYPVGRSETDSSGRFNRSVDVLSAIASVVQQDIVDLTAGKPLAENQEIKLPS